MGWHANKPAYGDKAVSKDVRENFEYLKALADGNVTDIAANAAAIAANAAAIAANVADIAANTAAIAALGNSVAIGNISASASGDQTYNIGFEPKVVFFFVHSNGHEQFSIGVDDGTLHRELHSSEGGPYSWSQTNSIQAISATGSIRGKISAKDSSGFTVTYTEIDIGSAQGFYLALQ